MICIVNSSIEIVDIIVKNANIGAKNPRSLREDNTKEQSNQDEPQDEETTRDDSEFSDHDGGNGGNAGGGDSYNNISFAAA
jgi:hypothetical protein